MIFELFPILKIMSLYLFEKFKNLAKLTTTVCRNELRLELSIYVINNIIIEINNI